MRRAPSVRTCRSVQLARIAILGSNSEHSWVCIPLARLSGGRLSAVVSSGSMALAQSEKKGPTIISSLGKFGGHDT